MNVWLVTIGEPVPISENKLRLHRTGILFDYLSKRGTTKTIWWTSNFSHFLKKKIDGDKKNFYSEEAIINLINSPGYKKNISIRRFYDHLILALNFRKLIKREDPPDIIICSFPTILLSYFSIRYSKKHKIPILIDFRDNWPDIFVDFLPPSLKFFGKIIFSPYKIISNYIFKNATGIISITNNFLKIALAKAKREKKIYDNYFPLGYNKLSSIKSYNGKLKKFPIDEKKINLCFIGTLGGSFNLDYVIDAFNSNKLNNFRIFICGDGDFRGKLEKKAISKNIFFPGYIDAIDIKYLLKKCQIGLCPYIPKHDFLNSIPGKAIEYMSEGLYLMSSLGNGVLGNFIKKNKIGINYSNSETFINQLKSIKLKKEDSKYIMDLYKKLFDSKVVYKNYIDHINFVVKHFNSK